MQKIIHTIYPLHENPLENIAFQLCEIEKQQGLHPIIHTLAHYHKPGKDLYHGVPIVYHRYIHPYIKWTQFNHHHPMGGDPISACLLKNVKKETAVYLYHTHALGHIAGITLAAAKKHHKPYIISLYTPEFDQPLIKKNFISLNWGRFFDHIWNTPACLKAAHAILCHTKTVYAKAKNTLEHPHIYYIDENWNLNEKAKFIQKIYTQVQSH